MKNNIVGVSMPFSEMKFTNIELISFNSYVSLLDFDIVLIDLNYVLLEYSFDENYSGKRLLTKNSSTFFLSDFKRIKNEINELLELGKTIYVNLPMEEVFFVYSGKKEYSGTGRNRQTTNLVEKMNLLDVLPVELNMTAAYGDKVSFFTDTIFKTLFKVKGMKYSYSTYFESENKGKPLAQVANSKKLISEFFSIGKGNLIIFPSVFYEDDYDNDKKYREVINTFLQTINDLEEEIKESVSEFSLPNWTKKYNIFDEKIKIQSLKDLEIEMKKIQLELEETNSLLLEVQKYKLMLSATGKELEDIVYKILLEMGFTSKPVEYNRADGIFEYGGKSIVTEIKGVNGSSAEKHGAQLEKWVSEFIEKENSIPKGILIVNGFRKKDLISRVEKVFPDQMVSYSSKREHCLISTTQLLCLFIEVTKNPINKEKIINELLNTVGVYTKYEDYKKYLEDNVSSSYK